MQQSNQDKIRYIFRKFPEVRYNRANFFWKYLEVYYSIKMYITENQFKDFFTNQFWGLERSVRDVLKEEEFRLPPENDSKRYEKASEFRNNYSKKLI